MLWGWIELSSMGICLYTLQFYFMSCGCFWCGPSGALKDGKVHAKIEGLRTVPYIWQDKQVKPNDGQTFVYFGIYPRGGGRGPILEFSTQHS